MNPVPACTWSNNNSRKDKHSNHPRHSPQLCLSLSQPIQRFHSKSEFFFILRKILGVSQNFLTFRIMVHCCLGTAWKDVAWILKLLSPMIPCVVMGDISTSDVHEELKLCFSLPNLASRERYCMRTAWIKFSDKFSCKQKNAFYCLDKIWPGIFGFRVLIAKLLFKVFWKIPKIEMRHFEGQYLLFRQVWVWQRKKGIMKWGRRIIFNYIEFKGKISKLPPEVELNYAQNDIFLRNTLDYIHICILRT